VLDGVADDLRSGSLGLGRALASLGFAEDALAVALGLENLRLLLAFGTKDFRLALAL